MNKADRQRGSLLFEAALAVGILMTMVTFVAKAGNDQQQVQKNLMIAAEHDIILGASRNFVSSRYSEILDDLYDEANISGKAVLTYSMEDLSDDGFLPEGYNGSILKKFYNQDYGLIVRAVDASDGSSPQDTLSFSEINDSGVIDPALLDGNAANGEMKIESLLVSYGGDTIARGAGGNILASMNSAFGGYVGSANTASGLYNSFDMDISKFSGEAAYPTAGHMASIVSLSGFGVIGMNEASEVEATVEGAFLRCDGMSGTAYDDCVSSNSIYTDIVLQPYDTDSDGTNDVFPALRNVTILDCGNDPGVVGVENEFTINCGTTRTTGDLDVAGDITATDVSASGDISAGSVHINGIGAEKGDTSFDLGKVILNSEIVNSGDDFPMPECGAASAQLSLTPVSYIVPTGEGNARIIGVYPEATTGSGKWNVQLVLKLLKSGNTIHPAYLSSSEGKLLAQSWCE